MGKTTNFLAQYEDPSKCLVRIITNSSFSNVFKEIVSKRILVLKETAKYMEYHFKEKISSENMSRLKLEVTRVIVKANMLSSVYLDKFTLQAMHLCVAMKNDIYWVTEKKLSSFFYRNFSTKMKKSGMFLRNWIILINFIMLLGICFIIPNLASNPQMVWKYITTEEIYWVWSVNIYFYSIFFVIMLYFGTRAPTDTAGLERGKKIVRDIKRINLGSKDNNRRLSPTQKFVAAVRKFINMKKIERDTEVNEAAIDKASMDKSTKGKYVALMVFWVYVNFSCYLLFISEVNKNQIMGRIEGMMCFYRGNPECYDETSFILIRTWYAINMMYVFIHCLQIKYGHVIFRSKLCDFKCMTDKLTIQVCQAIPFVPEIGVCAKYAGSQTSLAMDGWQLENDIRSKLQSAKFHQVSMEKKTFGKKTSCCTKLTIATTTIFFLSLCLFGPMLVFSNLVPSSDVYHMNQSSFSISIVDKKGQILGNFYNSTIILENKPVDFSSKEYKPLMHEESLLAYERNLFRGLVVSQYSSQYINFPNFNL